VELLAYFKIVWKRKWIVVSTTVLATVAAVVITLLLPRLYTASVRLRILTTPQGEIGSLLQYDLYYADRLMNTYVELMTSQTVRQELTERMGYDTQPKIAAEVVANTELLEVSVSHEDPVQAQRAANTLGEILVDQSRELYAGHGVTAADTLQAQLDQFKIELDAARDDYFQLVNETPENTEAIEGAQRSVQTREEIYYSLLERYEQARTVEAIQSNTVSIAEPAALPLEPSSPILLLNLGLGGVLGLVSGLGLAFIFENLDSRLDSPDQIEAATKLPILAEVPSARWRQQTQYLFTIYPYAEIFHRLRINLFGRAQDKPLHTLLITSADLAEGKSTIALNLASAVALAGHKVILIDADLRNPSLHERLSLPNEVGLNDVLGGRATLDEAVQGTQPFGLHVLTSGIHSGPPVQLMDSHRFSALLDEVKAEYDVVLIDSPAFMAVAESAVLASLVDGVLLIFRNNWVRRDSAERMLEELAIQDAKVLGVAVNRTNRRNYRRYKEYYPNQPALPGGQNSGKSRGKSSGKSGSKPARSNSQPAAPAAQPAPPVPQARELQTALLPDLPAARKDPLTTIKGIGEATEKSLNQIGIWTFEQLANQTTDELIEKLDLPFIAQRIQHDDWIEQARLRVQTAHPTPHTNGEHRTG
jgi:capsular exopolysaccharide synthesis family protein